MKEKVRIHCIICESEDIKKLFVKQKAIFFKCNQCGLISFAPRPSREDIKDYYNKEYYAPWKLGEEKIDSVGHNKVLTFQRWFDEIEGYRLCGKILDIGCAMGLLLEVAKERGWDPYGVEISEYSSNIAKKKLGARITTGVLSDVCFDNESFDAVTMFDLIEHEVSPAEFLREVFRILKPNGIIAISTVNTKSISCKIMGKNWPHFKTEHLYYFCPSTITSILNKTGFRVLVIKNAKKFLSLRYIKSYLDTYTTPILTGLSRLISIISPKTLANYPFRIPSGEMFVLARKNTT